jgi:hypothetical protein
LNILQQKLSSQNQWRTTKLVKNLISIVIDIYLVCIINQRILCFQGGLLHVDFINLDSKSISPETIEHQIVCNDFIIEGENKTFRERIFNEDDFYRFWGINQVVTIIRGHQYMKEENETLGVRRLILKFFFSLL